MTEKLDEYLDKLSREFAGATCSGILDNYSNPYILPTLVAAFLSKPHPEN